MPDQTPTDDERYEFDAALARAREIEAASPLVERRVDGRVVIWSPQPGSQELFMRCPLFECLYHGTRGPGKTDALLMDFAQHVGKWGAAWRGVIFRETYKQLADLIAKSERWFRRIFPSAEFNWWRHEWEWPSGEKLKFAFIRRPDDYWNWHGHELPFIGFEELTNWATDECYRRMMSCCRSSELPIDAPRWMRATTNPYGKGHGWVKDRFRLGGGAWRTPVLIEDARDERGNIEPPRGAIHGHIRENKILLATDPDYMQKVAASASSREQAKAWLEGSWDIVAGGMFGDVWRDRWNALGSFDVPLDWPIHRAFDWGSSRPFSVGWWARADGSDLRMDDGRVVSTVRGDLIRVREWYGTSGRPNEGMRLTAKEVAAGIVEREILWGWRRPGWSRVRPGPADSSIYVTENGICIATDMAQPVRLGAHVFEGVEFVPADKRPGSRKLGWEVMRKMLRAAWPQRAFGGRGYVPREEPGLFVVAERCPHWLRTVLVLPRDERDLDDVDCFVAGTRISTPSGPRSIESIRRGDLVDTPIGPRPVVRSYVSGSASTVLVMMSDGSFFQGTARHKVYVRDVGLRRLDELSCGLVLEPRSIETCASVFGIEAMESWRRASEVSRTGSTRRVDTLRLVPLTPAEDALCFIGPCGSTTGARSRMGCTSTMSTAIRSTIRSATSRCSTDPSTPGFTWRTGDQASRRLFVCGDRANEVDRRFARTDLRCATAHRAVNSRADIVGALSSRDIRLRSTALLNARIAMGLACSPRLARSAESTSGASRTGRARSGRARTRVVGVFVDETPQDVFNLTVYEAGLFFVDGGVLSSNTDAEDHAGDETRYMARGTIQGGAITRTRGSH